jgi:hypothetical protein
LITAHGAVSPPSSPAIPSRRPEHTWEELANGELIDEAEQAGFEVMVTTDKNIRYQQNLPSRKIALVVLANSQWPMVKLVTENIVATVNAAQPGSYVEVEVPFKE